MQNFSAQDELAVRLRFQSAREWTAGWSAKARLGLRPIAWQSWRDFAFRRPQFIKREALAETNADGPAQPYW